MISMVVTPEKVANFRSLASLICKVHIFRYTVFGVPRKCYHQYIEMGKLSRYGRKRVVSLYSCNVQITKITELLREEGIKTSRSAVSLFLSRYRQSASLHDAPRCGRKQTLTEEQVKFIDDKMTQNDELTAAELKEKLAEEFGVYVSLATIRRIRRDKLGWKHENTRYCQFVREPNKTKILIFCLTVLEEKDSFEDAIFTDETSVQIEQYARLCFHKKGTQP